MVLGTSGVLWSEALTAVSSSLSSGQNTVPNSVLGRVLSYMGEMSSEPGENTFVSVVDKHGG